MIVPLTSVAIRMIMTPRPILTLVLGFQAGKISTFTMSLADPLIVIHPFMPIPIVVVPMVRIVYTNSVHRAAGDCCR